MPRIFDNIENGLLPALKDTLNVSNRADFCVGYFNLRGWKAINDCIDKWAGGDQNQCRLLVGMHHLPFEELREAFQIAGAQREMDNASVLRLKKKLAEEFRDQLSLGAPTNEDELGLRKLSQQLKEGKVRVKLYLRHLLHAKLYLCFRVDPNNPITGFLGSSNLTFSGLSKQGELNIDVLDQDATAKLAKWFNDRWEDRWCVDITEELIKTIEQSWARETSLPPYHIYIKIAYHLAQEARAGLSQFRIPNEFKNRLFDYQIAAVKIAAHHLNKRHGVLIGDVVGLGKTLMATALAKVFQEDQFTETLILCPKNLKSMWENYRDEYRLLARVMAFTEAPKELPKLRRYRVVLIDESHNLRNRLGSRYKAIQEYIYQNESRCILLSATPYNKSYIDLSNQLRLFIPEDKDLGIRPESLIREIGETEFIRRHQCPVRSLAAFEKSEAPDDWRELMRHFMVRRTRSFIQANYAQVDTETSKRYLTFQDGSRSYFPIRVPKTVRVKVDSANPQDQYAQLFSDDVVNTINSLSLPRYGLGNYIAGDPQHPPTASEGKILGNLSRAGKRLMGFCRTNLFKRLESSGAAFRLSVERHILRNFIYLHALENNLPLPIGKQDSDLLDTEYEAEDTDEQNEILSLIDGKDKSAVDIPTITVDTLETRLRNRAVAIYQHYSATYKSRFKWLPTKLFVNTLKAHISSDSSKLVQILRRCGQWNPATDTKLAALKKLLSKTHPNEKILIFTQFADTVHYLAEELKVSGIKGFAGVTGQSEEPTELAWRFSPNSNRQDTNKNHPSFRSENELRILIATDVLSEGQNLQDAAIIVNYDLPWAIIRLIQRAGRVDRIGQRSDKILCYSFLPAEGIERLIRLRARVSTRLRENAEVVGTDEAFFEGDRNSQNLADLYNEKSGILDGDADTEVDLASYAYQIWKNATDADPTLKGEIEALPDVVYSTKTHTASQALPSGVLVYMRTADGTDALAWVDKDGRPVTQSQLEILRAAECDPNTFSTPRRIDHHDLVRKAAEHILAEEKSAGGQLGRPSGARFRVYEQLKRYAETVKGTLFEQPKLTKAIEDIYRYPLRQSATDTLNRQLRAGITDEALAELVVALRDEDRLCIVHEENKNQEPRIICSLGLLPQSE